jgi:hypothetical protein
MAKKNVLDLSGILTDPSMLDNYHPDVRQHIQKGFAHHLGLGPDPGRFKGRVQGGGPATIAQNEANAGTASAADPFQTGESAFSQGIKQVAQQESLDNLSVGDSAIVPAPKKSKLPGKTPDWSQLGDAQDVPVAGQQPTDHQSQSLSGPSGP